MREIENDFARLIVANAFDQAIEFVQNQCSADPDFFSKKLKQEKGGNSQNDYSLEILIAAAAAEHALAAFFSNLQLEDVAKIMIEDSDGQQIDLEEYLGKPYLACFQKDGWLGRFAKNAELAKIWQE